jgi:hypothetical protein
MKQSQSLIAVALPLEENSADKSHRGSASQFFVAGELCRRGLVAVITMGNCPNTDILVSNKSGTRFAHVQVKTFVPGIKTCSVGFKSEKSYGPNFFWVLAGIPEESCAQNEYFIIPAEDMAREICKAHQLWLNAPGKKGQAHNNTKVRTVHLPPLTNLAGWSIEQFRNQWKIIEEVLKP